MASKCQLPTASSSVADQPIARFPISCADRCVIIWKIVKRYSGAGAVLWNVLAAVGIACGAIVINALVVFNNGCLEGIFDDELYYRDGKVYLESDIWFSSDVNVEVYESENPNDGFVEKEVAKTEISSILDDRIKAKEEEEAKKKAEEEKAKKAAAAKKAALAKANTKSSSSTSTKTTSQSLGITLSYPISGGKVSSRFGSRSSIRSSAHTGLDLSAPYGTPIHPVSNGTVTFAGTRGSYGKLIIVSHGNGVETWYGHCSSINVSAGQSVTTSTTIGAVGSTGNSTGNHLHLEIRKDGTPLNPQNYLY